MAVKRKTKLFKYDKQLVALDVKEVKQFLRDATWEGRRDKRWPDNPRTTRQ